MGNAIYTACCAGDTVESFSLTGAVSMACRALGLDESRAFTVQKDPGTWALVADPRDAYASTIIRIASSVS